MAATYYERRLARNSRGREPVYPQNLPVINALRERCQREGRIPLTDEALAVCRAAGLATVAEKVVRRSSDIDVLKMHNPVALKLLSRDASHKSDVGGVKVGLRTKKALREAVSQMEASMAAFNPPPSIDGFSCPGNGP